MFNKYSLEISKIFKNAEDLMLELMHPYVGTEHLLLSLLKNDLKIKNICLKYNLTYENFKNELINIVGEASKKSTFILYTPLLKRVINLALEESFERKEKLNSIHLMKALIEEGEGIAIRIMYSMKIDLDKLYDEISYKNKIYNKKLEICSIGKVLNDEINENEVVYGREKEIELIIETLIRKNKNNPLLVGDAGVGKTAIVEELVRRINAKKVPYLLQDKKIVMLEMASLVAGTKYRGEFEEKLTRLIKELENNPNIILFVDEIHTIVNAGGAEGAINASDILKPYLARGKVKIIGATTTLEYNKFILKDKALNRRFELIKVKEPSDLETVDIIINIKSSFEKHYNIKITNQNIKDLVALTSKYIIERKNPDKSIDLLDSVCAMKKVAKENIEKINYLKNKKDFIVKQKELMVKKNDFSKALEFYNLEQNINNNINKLSNEDLKITKNDILNLISRKCNIPLNNKIDYKNLEKSLNNKIIGQDVSIKSIINNLKNRPNDKPLSLLLVGSTGVGKTESVKIIAQELNINLLRLDMSEYNQDIAISRLIGSSAGYVGYDDGAVLDKIKMEPFSIILLDEIEKASPSVLNLFLQILDDGFVTNAKGEKINFKNTIIFATSNAKGNKKIGFIENKIKYDDFSKEFIARFSDIIPFNDIDEDMIIKYFKKNKIYNYELLKDFDYHKNGFRGLDKFVEKNKLKEKLNT